MFSGEELRKLKEGIADETLPGFVWLKELVARLEAAEALLDRLWGDDDMSDKDLDKDHEAYKAWRKAARK